MRKVLIAIDGSESSFKAVDYVGQQFGGPKDLQITLFHVLSGVRPELWDDGHILTDEERAERKAVLDKWLANQNARLSPLFREATDLLTRRGISPEQIGTKFVSEAVKTVAECILAEAKAGDYNTLVLGRCGRSPVKHRFLGSIASQLINSGAGIATCVVE